MRVPASRPRIAAARSRAAVTVVLALGLAACGSSAASSTSQPAAAATIASASGSAATHGAAASGTAAPTARATVVPSVSPTPAATSAVTLGSLKLLWQGGGPVTDRTSTVATAIDPVTGNLWVAVPFENRYWIMSPDGKYLESWGKAGTGPGQFDFSDHAQTPDAWGAIAFTPDGGFYVGDTGNHRVQQFDKSRRFVRAWGTFGTGDGQFVQIVSVATDGKTVYVGDGDRYDTQAFDSSGTFVRSFGADGGFYNLALDAKGVLHATNAQNPVGAAMAMATFGSDGKELARVDLGFTGGAPSSVSTDDAGNSYVTIEIDKYPWTALGTWEIDPAERVVRGWKEGADVATVTPGGDALYLSRGIQLDTTQWPNLQKYALPKP
jgi:hypothetical protein